jgi:hypothetical protein
LENCTKIILKKNIMKNKKLMYGLLAVGAIALYYYWDKMNKKSTCSTCPSAVKPEGTPTSDSYSAMGGYANAGGGAYGLGCKVCERPNRTTYFSQFGSCADGDVCITSKRLKKA